MPRRTFSAVAATVLLVASIVHAQPPQQRARSYPPKMPDATVETYKTIGDVELNAYIFYPDNHKPSDKRAAIVFFFGGGWKSGTPGQFEQQCKHLASRGMVAVTADYRVASRHETKAVACVADAKSAVRWLRQNADRLGIDPQRIVAGGGSAGGHIAACTGVVVGFDETGEDMSISSRPNAMALFNPALVLASVDDQPPLDEQHMAGLRERMGTDPQNLSPYHHVAKNNPRTIIFHGEADTTVPYRTAEQFTEAMKKAGNRCELIGFPGEPHGFFNYGRGGNAAYNETLKQLDKFLVSLGYLD